MPITLQHQGDNVYRLEVRGTLLKADLDRCQDELAGQMVRTGPVRVLFVLAGFTGWEKDANWSDLSFYMKHGDRIERIAIVGDERWRDEALMFAAAGLRKGPVEFFTEEADARKWLTAEGRPAGP
jgi:SpoIIAA-like